MIARALPPQEDNRHDRREALGRDHGEPHAVKVEHQRQQNDQTAAQQQRAQERNEGAQSAVAQGGKEGRGVDIDRLGFPDGTQ